MCTSHLTHLILNEQIEYYNILYYFHQIYRKRKGTLVWRVTFEQRGEEFEAMTDRWGSGVHSLIFTLPFGLLTLFFFTPPIPNTQIPIPFLTLFLFLFLSPTIFLVNLMNLVLVKWCPLSTKNNNNQRFYLLKMKGLTINNYL